MVLPWRNHPDVRRFMFTQHEISAQEHAAFFAQALRDPTRAYYLGMDDEAAVGLVSLINLDANHKTAEWGFYVRPGAPVGTGRRMLMLALDRAFGDDGLVKLSGEAFAFNQASIRLHLRLGFAIEGILRSHRVCAGQRCDVVRMGIPASHWTPEHRSWLGHARGRGSREDGVGASMVFRPAASVGGLPSLVSNVLAACVGNIVSLRLDGQRVRSYAGAVELHLHTVARSNGVDTFDIQVLDAVGNKLATGHANVIATKGPS